jgi:ABC-type transport system involved in cytochrome c biogenesis permease component
MTFLPIVERELRTAARQRVTHRLRWVAAGLALLIWFALALAGNNLTPSQRATAIFGTISILSLGFAMVAGVFLTADCLSEERREGTLGLLFLTDLKGHDVVLGKLASTSLHSIYGLLAVVPMLAIPLLMGGVTPGEFARSALVLLVTLFLSLSAGMFVSAISHDSRAALLRTLGIVVFLSGVMPMLWWGLWWLFRRQWLDFLLWPSPGYALRCAGDAYFSTRTGAGEFWRSLCTIGGFGISFLVTASLLLPRVWHQAREDTGGRQKQSPGSAAFRQSNAARAWLETNPYFWLATRDDRVGRWALWIIGAAQFVWFGFLSGIWSPRPTSAAFSITMLLTFTLHVIFKCMVAVEATRRLSEDRQSGALELLLVTPLPPADIITGQRQALGYLFRWSRRMLVGMNLVFLCLILQVDRTGWLGPDRTIFGIMFVGGIVLLWSDCFVMGTAGIWSALTTKRHPRAILKTLRNVLLPSWAAILLFWFIGIVGNGMNSGTVETMIGVWIGFGLAVDALVLGVTKTRLGSDFRELAATGRTRPTEPGARATP